MKVNTVAGMLLSLAQEMVEEGIVDPLTFNCFRADDFKIYRRKLSIRFPWGGTIRFNPEEMSVYVLFLRNPSGIRKEDMWQHYSELLELYRHYALSTDPDWTANVVDNLCDTDENKSFLFLLSHIRGKISRHLGELVSMRFAINRASDGRYRIAALRG